MPKNSNNVNVETKGAGLFLVDPNPSDRNVVPAEDMFIYVKLTATERSRGVITLGQNDNEFDESRFGEIDFIATEVKYDTTGQPQKDIMGDVKSYATTNYTQIGGIQNTFGSGLLEGFGITSINIKYNTSLVPQVDIEFTDLRGSGLFDVIEQENRKSPYSIFFKMPYPVFSLTIKGYFGKPVEYCLNLVNWTSKFDPSTGNFNISANFVGFQQAFLADLTLGDIIGTVNTTEGAENLNQLPLTVGVLNEEGETTTTETNIPTPPFDKFIKQLSKLQIDLEKLKFDSESYKDLTILNTQQKKLEDIRDFIGFPLPKDNSETTIGNNTKYLNQLNNPNIIDSARIKEGGNLNKFKNYISVRDILFFNQTVKSEVDIYMQDLYDKLEDYKKFFLENKSKLDNNDRIIKNDVLNVDVFPFSSSEDSQNIDYSQLIIQFSNSGSNGELLLKQFIDELRGGNSILKKNNPKTLDSVNNNFSVSGVTLQQFSSDDLIDGGTTIKGNKNSDFSDTTVGFPVDFRAMRAYINDMLITLKDKKKEKEEKTIEELNKKLSKELGYKPTIGTVFEILCNNAQAFIKTVYGVAKKAENNNKKRQKALSKIAGKLQTDLETKEKNDYKSQTIYAFPSVFIEENGGFVEKYIGSKDVFEEGDTVSKEAFPEIKFITDIVQSVTEKEAKLTKLTSQVIKASKSKSGADTDNWLPINPIDYSVNPFYFLNVNNASSGAEKLKEQFIKILVERYVVLKNYSKYDDIQNYGKWDGLLANYSLLDDTIRNVLYTFLNGNQTGSTQTTTFDIKDLKKYYPNINDNEEITKEDFKFGDISVRDIGDDEGQFLIVGDTKLGKKILNNNINIPTTIKDKKNYQNKFVKNSVKNKSKLNYEFWDSSDYNYYSNQSYRCWFSKVSSKILPKKGNAAFDIKDDNITLIDGGINPKDNPQPNTKIVTDYINIFSKDNNNTPIELEKYLTDTNFYNEQTDNAKALLLLSTLPLSTFGVLKLPTVSTIMVLPKYFLLFIGGTLWRESQTTDPININSATVTIPNFYNENEDGNSINNISQEETTIVTFDGNFPPQNEYISPFWDSISRGNIETELLNLPKQTKENLIKFFTDWVSSREYVNFTKTVIKYSEEEDIKKKYDFGTTLASILSENIELIVVSPEIFQLSTKGETKKLTVKGFENYFKSFKNTFTNTLNDKNDNNINNESTDNTKNLESVKQSAYNSIKNVYDRWIAGSTGGDIAYNACGDPTKDLFDYFRFIDRGFNDIGDKAIINLQSVISVSNNMQTNLYFYMSNLLRHSNFLFQIMPNYINYKDSNEVSDMFKPITNVSDRNTSSGPTYLCIYAGGTSQVLDIDEKSRYTFKNDGFNFDLPPTDIATRKSLRSGEDFNLVAFRVAFGAENQTIFKSVSLNQQEHKDTSEYFATLTDLIDKRGGTNRTYQGTDLYKMFRARSYTCNVEALGCMNIQPMMYFQLDNVPFFEGAYMILNVTHNITPNHMTTSFTGVRQSKYLTPVVDKMTTFLDINLDENLESENLAERSLVPGRTTNYNTGIPLDKNPDAEFDFSQITESTLLDLGISENTSEITQNLKSLNLNIGAINTNSQFSMFLANCMTSSNNFKESVEVWNDKTETKGKELYVEPNNPFGNRDVEDAYNFRKRGYIPIVGRDQYIRFSEQTNTPMTELTGDTITVSLAMKISQWRWFNYPYSNSYHNTVEINLLLANQQERAAELQNQIDPKLLSVSNYPPIVYGDGGTANNFAQTLSLLTFKEGSNMEKGFDNFTKVLNILTNGEKDEQGNSITLLGTTTSGNKANLKKGSLYTSALTEAANLISTALTQ